MADERSGNGKDPQAADAALAEGIHINKMYEDWFLDYASYVILDRAVPYMEDGLKPVQRRILHTMKLLHDGRYHKVANIIGRTMTFHPHGDASIGDALVHLGQKGLLVDTQGNWGNPQTGDPAAAPRYIEARLTPFALDVLFNPELTTWQLSYDGRAKEPEVLPVKFPLLLAHGVEGIAVGLSTKILPHNFVELVKGSIKILEGKKPKLFPDFLSGGMADVGNYNDGKRGGRVKVRGTIEILDNKTLVIRELPYGATTLGLIDSILSANDKGKIRIKRVEDNTARDVEILIHLPQGASPDVTMDALYAFTDCEVSISPNCCIVEEGRPRFLGVSELLEMSTFRTKEILRQELELKLRQLEDKWHFSSLEKIFIEERIYRDIEECETWEAVLEAIDRGLDPFKDRLKRDVTEDDIVRLTEIKIKRISKYDSFKADEKLKALEDEIKATKLNLKHLNEYAIAYFEDLLARYGKGRERRTKLTEFHDVDAQVVAAPTKKLYVDREGGFIGTGLKKAEQIGECSDLDEVIAFRADGCMQVSKVDDKVFMGKDILYAGVFQRGDERTIYHMVYRDGKSGPAMAKRFAVKSITRDKEYDLTAGNEGSKVLHFSVHPQGEAETVDVQLSPRSKARIKRFDYDFGELKIKSRNAKGNILTKYPVKKIAQKEVGASTLAPEEIYFDKASGRLNTEGHGDLLGEFGGDDKILAVYETGDYEVTDFNPQNVYGQGLVWIGKRPSHGVVSCVYYNGEKDDHYVKRFAVEAEVTGKRVSFLEAGQGHKIAAVSLDARPQILVTYKKGKRSQPDPERFDLAAFIDVKGTSAQGNKLSRHVPKKIELLEPLPAPEPPAETPADDHDAPASRELTADGKASGGHGQGALFPDDDTPIQ